MEVRIILTDTEDGILCKMDWDGDNKVNIMDVTPAMYAAKAACEYLGEVASGAATALKIVQAHYAATHAADVDLN